MGLLLYTMTLGNSVNLFVPQFLTIESIIVFISYTVERIKWAITYKTAVYGTKEWLKNLVVLIVVKTTVTLVNCIFIIIVLKNYLTLKVLITRKKRVTMSSDGC